MAITFNAANPLTAPELNAAQTAAVALGLETVRCEIRRGEDIAAALEALKGNADALYVCVDPLVNTNGVRINALALAARLPTMHSSRDNIDAGGMISYRPDITDLFRRAAEFVDKILSGAKRAIFRSSSRRSSNWSSISGPPRRSAWRFRRRCSPAPTR
jgi:putative tryptophan/tyrosine transport system substrate-binding protein